jgi:hypothetical protein
MPLRSINCRVRRPNKLLYWLSPRTSLITRSFIRRSRERDPGPLSLPGRANGKTRFVRNREFIYAAWVLVFKGKPVLYGAYRLEVNLTFWSMPNLPAIPAAPDA